jgi:hypothetical protein
MQKYSILTLFLIMLFAGCGQEPCEYHTVEITGIPAEYNRQGGDVIIGNLRTEYYRGTGTISDEKLIVDIYESKDHSRTVWRGSGDFPVMLLTGFGMLIPGPSFIYTNGKTFQELQIDMDTCDIFANIFYLDNPDVLDKLPKIKFRKPEDGGGKTRIKFNELQMLDCEWWSLE